MNYAEADWLLATLLTSSEFSAEAAMGKFSEVPVVRYDNVHQYWSESEQINWEVDSDFPCIRPPFDLMWMISGGATWLTASEGQKAIMPTPIATLCQSKRLSDTEIGLSCGHFMNTKGRPTFVVESRFVMNHDGVPRGNATIPLRYADLVRTVFGPEPDTESFSMFAASLYQPVLMALSFLHCKNVNLQPSPPARSVIRANKDAVAKERWHELVIGGITKRLDAERASGVSLPKALHICRGHFATYSETAPLFGRYAGRYWRPAHARGVKEAGEVHKTYRVTS
jgi:hypothetical protein